MSELTNKVYPLNRDLLLYNSLINFLSYLQDILCFYIHFILPTEKGLRGLQPSGLSKRRRNRGESKVLLLPNGVLNMKYKF